MRHLLMIAYDFPPVAHVAAQRPGKFARDLPRFGWRATVVTPRRRPDAGVDPATLAWIPAGTRVVRTVASPLRPGLGLLNRAAPGLGAAAARWIVPDPEVGWVPPAVAAALRAAEADPPDAVWATCGPNSVALAGAAAGRALGVPCILDLCNEWTGNPYFDPPTGLHRRAHAALERRVIAAAAAVVTLNPVHTETLACADPAGADRYVTIEGGVDTDEIPARTGSGSGRRLTFAYTGSIYGAQGPDPLLDAVDAFVAGGGAAGDEILVRLAGADYAGAGASRRRVEVRREGRLAHDAALRVLAEADVLFLCLPERLRRQLPTKLYEYMASGRPILAVVPPASVAARRVVERGAGWVAAAEDRNGLIAALREVHGAWRRGTLPTCDGPASVAPYTRVRMAETLAGLLDRVVATRGVRRNT